METASNKREKEPSITSAVLLLDRGVMGLTTLMAYVGIGALTVAIVVVVVDVVWRRIGGGSFIGAVDLTQFSVVAAASWAIPFAFARNAHVSVDILHNQFSSAVARFLDAAAALISAALMAFVLWLSWGRAMEIWGYGDVSQDLAVPMILFWSFLLSGLAVSFVTCIVNFLKILTVDVK